MTSQRALTGLDGVSARRADAFSELDPLLAAAGWAESPWRPTGGPTPDPPHRPPARPTPSADSPTYHPDWDLLGRLVAVPVGQQRASQSGHLAKAIDAWAAHELRRAGFDADAVWPRPRHPRILSHDLVTLLNHLPAALATQLRERLDRMPAVAPKDARILGRAYQKQVDVCMTRWDRGPELLISTKTQDSSFGKNLSNRFEEAYGDAGNLRGRHPLAAVGFLFVQRATVRTLEPAAYERTIDMMRKLRDRGDGNGYTATGLVLLDWDPPSDGTATVRVDHGAVPHDIGAPQFFAALIDQVLSAAPVTDHADARRRRAAPNGDPTTPQRASDTGTG